MKADVANLLMALHRVQQRPDWKPNFLSAESVAVSQNLDLHRFYYIINIWYETGWWEFSDQIKFGHLTDAGLAIAEGLKK